jgi:hypothetical protein
MALASYITYFDMDLLFDTTTLLGNTSEVPYLKNEPFQLKIVQSFHQEGYTVPTKSQIEEGELGDMRIIPSTFFDKIRSIPAYPILFFALFGLSALFWILKSYQIRAQ